MQDYIEIEIVNFKHWLNKTIRLVQGVNLLVGKSGSGKSTICNAIYFVLYGGRKFRNITNNNNKNSPTQVSFHFCSSSLEYKIIRKRPSEELTIFIKDNTGVYELKGLSAQEWINNNYGVENIWLSASFISRKKPHFLLDSNNADKMDLLQRISFGDISLDNQPEFFLLKTKNEINNQSEMLKAYNEDIKIKNSIIQSLIMRCPDINSVAYINVEDQLKLKSDFDEKTVELDNLKSVFTKIQSRRQIQSTLNNLPIVSISNDDIHKELNDLSLQREKLFLSKKLINFDEDVLTTDYEELKMDNFLYETYIKAGWKDTDSLQDFLNLKKKEHTLYHSQLKLDEKNATIVKNNIKTEDANRAMKRAYDKQMSDYNSIMKDIDVYEKRKMNLKARLEDSKNDQYIKFSDDDEMSSSWLIKFKSLKEISLHELICPNCSRGLVYNNGVLELGKIVSDSKESHEEIRRKINETISMADIEYTKRKRREDLLLEEREFLKLTCKQKPDLPEEQKYYKLEELLPTKNLKEPNVNIFDVPKNTYSKYKSLWYSYPLLELFHKNMSINIEVQFTEDQIELQCKKLSQMKNENNKIIDERRSLEAALKTLPHDDLKIEENIQLIYNRLQELNRLLNIALITREIESVKTTVDSLSVEVNKTIGIIDNLQYFYSKVEQLGVSVLESKITDLNIPLGLILNDLFEEDIEVKLTPYKTLKNGDTKLQVNFSISYKGVIGENIDGLSDGEEGRLSLALLMAFSRMNNNPFVIVDEVLSSMDEELKIESVDIINKWTSGKFVIHICHSVTEGQHYNVIHF